MKHLFTTVLVATLLLSFSYSNAQDVKKKTKGDKTKVKGTTATTMTDTTSTSAPGANGSNTSATTTFTNTTWKGFIGDPLNDTLVWKFAADTVFAHSKTGDILVTSNYKVLQDTLEVSDVSGQYACPFETGRYRFTLEGDTLSLTLIADNCEGRGTALNSTKWQKVKSDTGQ